MTKRDRMTLLTSSRRVRHSSATPVGVVRLLAIAMLFTGCDTTAQLLPCVDVSWAVSRACRTSDWRAREVICKNVARCKGAMSLAKQVIERPSSTHGELLAAVMILANGQRPESDDALVACLRDDRALVRESAIVSLNTSRLHVQLPDETLKRLEQEPIYENQVLLATLTRKLPEAQARELRVALEELARKENADRICRYGTLRHRLDDAVR